ncbi:hypothetical protein [Streptosporangium roseum]
MSAYLAQDEPDLPPRPAVGGPSDDIEDDWHHRHYEQDDDGREGQQ